MLSKVCHLSKTCQRCTGDWRWWFWIQVTKQPKEHFERMCKGGKLVSMTTEHAMHKSYRSVVVLRTQCNGAIKTCQTNKWVQQLRPLPSLIAPIITKVCQRIWMGSQISCWMLRFNQPARSNFWTAQFQCSDDGRQKMLGVVSWAELQR